MDEVLRLAYLVYLSDKSRRSSSVQCKLRSELGALVICNFRYFSPALRTCEVQIRLPGAFERSENAFVDLRFEVARQQNWNLTAPYAARVPDGP
jgi:hypothetical protein